jgi:hypothetical protein
MATGKDFVPADVQVDPETVTIAAQFARAGLDLQPDFSLLRGASDAPVSISSTPADAAGARDSDS